MSKLSYILIVLILCLLGAIGVTVFVKNNTPTDQGVTYTDFSVILPSTTGPRVTVPNFLKDPSVTADTKNEGLYYIGNTFTTPVTGTTPTYVVTYEKDTGYFNITLLQKPLAAARSDAETYLKNLLKVDETSLCGLSYTVSVPGYVDEEASGIDYRFSFCPDSVKLSQ